jgi:hypothetical protein
MAGMRAFAAVVRTLVGTDLEMARKCLGIGEDRAARDINCYCKLEQSVIFQVHQ